MLRSSLCDYRDAYIPVSGTIMVAPFAAGGRSNNIQLVFKNCAPFTNWISKINNTQTDNAKDIDVVIPMYNLIKYSDNYSETSGSLWQYCRSELVLNNDDTTTSFSNNSVLFKFKQKRKGSTGDDDTKNIEITVPLKHLSNFLTTLEMPLIKCEINVTLTWSGNCVISNAVANQGTTFAITATNFMF